jgi:TolB protein
MDQKRRWWVLLVCVVIMGVSCSIFNRPRQQIQEDQFPTPTQVTAEPEVGWSGGDYRNQDFSFSVPESWNVHEGPSAQGENSWNYFGLNLEILVEAKSRHKLPKVSITRRDIPAGSSLKEVFEHTYAEISEQINQVAETETGSVDGSPALVKRYNRPWGEPWYSFQDAWLEKNGQIYVVSCQLPLNHSQEDQVGCDTILDSLHFTVEVVPASPEPPAGAEVVESLPPGGCPDNQGKLVFSYDPMDLSGVHYGIYVMGPDGGDRTRLSGQDERNHTMPSWSPERCRIAFSSHTPDGDEDIFVMNADGTSIRRLTNDPAREIFPEWSPDGKQIAFISYRDGYRNLFVMEADGSQPRQLTFNQKEFTQWLAWSPSGEYIAYTYNPEGSEIGESIHIIRPDGSEGRQVTPPAGRMHDGEPTWSPDSQKLYFLSNRSAHVEIWEINLDGSELKQISNLYAAGIAVDHSLRISPDGGSLVFYGAGQDASFMTDLFRLRVDGSDLTNLTGSNGKEEWVDW